MGFENFVLYLGEEPRDEDGRTLRSFFPDNGPEIAVESGARKGLRKNQSPEDLLRTLLIH
jgi:hypothetical protein